LHIKNAPYRGIASAIPPKSTRRRASASEGKDSLLKREGAPLKPAVGLSGNVLTSVSPDPDKVEGEGVRSSAASGRALERRDPTNPAANGQLN